jgi:tRNA 2-thiouridine synthesizing protein D
VKFAIQINSAPWQGANNETAYQFIRAALQGGHEIVRVFFYYDGAYHGLRQMAPPEDEKALLSRWSALATEYGVDLVICIAAAARRGLLENVEIVREDELAAGFRIGGLGLWVEACLRADRVLVLG